MKHLNSLIAGLLLSTCAIGQQTATTATAPEQAKKTATPERIGPAFVAHSWLASASFGFINGYRQDFSVPSGFERNNTSGFAPIYGRLEYATSAHVGIAATIVYNEFYGNYYKLYSGNGQEYKRYKTDMTTIYSGGLSVNYHFGNIIPVKRMDVFIIGGFLLNSTHHSAIPQGDSIISMTDRTVTPVLRAGIRYYIAGRSSFFADAGYDKQSVLSVGYSCRFMKKAATAQK